MSAKDKPFSRLKLGTVVLGAIALAFVMAELRRDNEPWATRRKLTTFAPTVSMGDSAARESQFPKTGRHPPKATPDRAAILPPVVERAPSEHSPIADNLHSPDRTGIEDMRVVMNLFTHYRDQFGGYPTGEDNATMMNALTGNNPSHMAFINRGHRAIDAQGQLLDRWGSPLFFHLVARDALEIRSAGPDNEFYTADDLVTASPSTGRTRLADGSQEE